MGPCVPLCTGALRLLTVPNMRCLFIPFQVRKRISIIPQEPVMFKGTVRSNLDPFGTSSDNELWHALKLVHLRDAVAGKKGLPSFLPTVRPAHLLPSHRLHLPACVEPDPHK
jgi:hypothetical protein